MANKKISELPSATTPLSGTELFEIVQGGINKKVAKDDVSTGGTSIPYGVTSGTNTYTIAATPAVTAYTDGMLLHIRVGNSSTGLVTLNFDSLGAKKLFDTAGTQAQDGYLKAGVDYLVVYNAALDGAVGGFTVVNELVHGVMNLRGTFVSAGGGVWPTGAGSGPGGGIRHGDVFIMGDADTLGTKVVNAGDFITTTVDNPGQNDSLWYVIPGPNSIVGVQDLFVPASAMWPRVTGGSSILTQFEMATSLFNIQALAFDQTTQEFAQFQIALPRKWNNGTVTAVPYWTAQSGSGTVQWAISGGAYSNDDALTVALGTAQTSDDTLIATNDLHIGPETAAITLAGTPADADFLAFQVSRNPGSDTLSGDALLLGISIRVTTNAAKDA